MGYVKHNDQSGVEPGYVIYRFELRHKETRHRKMVTCRKSVVQAVYRKWEDSILIEQPQQYRFFEIVDEYLN